MMSQFFWPRNNSYSTTGQDLLVQANFFLLPIFLSHGRPWISHFVLSRKHQKIYILQKWLFNVIITNSWFFILALIILWFLDVCGWGHLSELKVGETISLVCTYSWDPGQVKKNHSVYLICAGNKVLLEFLNIERFSKYIYLSLIWHDDFVLTL